MEIKKETLRELLIKKAFEIAYSSNEFGENMIWTIQEYYSSYGEFNEDDFDAVKELLKEDASVIFECVAPDEQLYSDGYEELLEYFVENGYPMDLENF